MVFGLRPFIGLGLSALSLAAASPALAGDREALWKIVHDKCVPDEQTKQDPAPCSAVDLAEGVDKGYVVLKDLVGATQFLLIATRKIAGIESPDLLAPDSTNYFAAAWNARTYLLAKAPKPLPRDAIGLAINSTLARSQDQLHIHIDCLLPDVRKALIQHVSEIGETLAPLGFDLVGHRYRALRIDKPDLDGSDPFKILADADATAKADMSKETLVVVGAEFAEGDDGFLLLERRADPANLDFAHGEELQDHDCAVATMVP